MGFTHILKGGSAKEPFGNAFDINPTRPGHINLGIVSPIKVGFVSTIIPVVRVLPFVDALFPNAKIMALASTVLQQLRTVSPAT
jgi:hypothetical protein